MQIRLISAIFGAAMVSLLAACGSDDAPNDPGQGNPPALSQPLLKLTPFASQTEFDEFLRKASTTDFFVPEDGRTGGSTGAPAPALGDGAPNSGAAPDSTGHSSTNIQEAGVDEPDTVKTDGTYLYVAGRQKVSIVTAGQTLAKAGEINIPGYPTNLLLTDDKKLIVFYSPESGALAAREPSIGYFYYALSGVMIVDVADPANPAVVRSVVMEGGTNGVRRVGDTLYVVLGTQAFAEPLPLDTPKTPSDSPTTPSVALTSPASTIAPSGGSRTEKLPQLLELNAEATVTASGPLIEVTEIYRPDLPRGNGMVVIVGINLADPAAAFDSIGYLGYASVIYSSITAIYVADEQWIGAPAVIGVPTTGSSPPQANTGGAAAGDALPTPARALQDGPHTVVHKFALTDSGVALAASGEVFGNLLDQHALSEAEGFLRVATSNGWNQGASVSVLEQQASALVTVGSLTDIGVGENLFAARFVGNRGFLVTFLRTDPLFTIDLSDPRAPLLAGELVMPGFSDYLHPVDNDHLLGIGRDATSDGRQLGVQLSVFDVSNFAAPAITDKAVIGSSGTDSEANWNPKAFTFWPAQQLIAFPIREFKQTFAPTTEPSFYNGVYVFRLLPDFTLAFVGQLGKNVEYYTQWSRAVFVADRLYSVSDVEVSLAALDDVATEIASLQLEDLKPTPPPVLLGPPVVAN